MNKQNLMIEAAIFIAIGGALGALLRYITVVGFQQWFGGNFPYGTLTVNVVGSLIIGGLYAYSLHWQLPLSIKLGIMVGLLGALTTYSSFALDTLILIEKNELSKAAINVITNISGSLVAVFFGFWLIKKISE